MPSSPGGESLRPLLEDYLKFRKGEGLIKFIGRIRPGTHVTVNLTGKPAQVNLTGIPVQARAHTRKGKPYILVQLREHGEQTRCR